MDAYCIHLRHRTDREEHILKMQSKYPNIHIKFVDAVRDTEGARGCLLSHKKAIRYAQEKNLPWILVLEDDCDFLLPENELMYHLKTITDMMERDPAIEIVSGCGNLGPHSQVLDGTRINSSLAMVRCNRMFTTHCILYNKSIYDRILDLPIGVHTTPIDVSINHFKLKCTYPFLASQIPSYSNIIKVDVNYEMIFQAQTTIGTWLEQHGIHISPREENVSSIE